MKKQIMSLMLAMIMCIAVFSISAFAVNPPEIFKDEYVGIDSDKDEIYNGDDDWNIYYSYVDDISFIEYTLELKKAGYEFVGKTPDYIQNYITSGQKPFLSSDKQYTVKMAKQDYARIVITYINREGIKNANYFEYTMSLKIMPGNEPATLPQTTQEEQTTQQQSTTIVTEDVDIVTSSNNNRVCSVCGFCPSPAGHCVFVWAVILVAISLVITAIVVAVKKKKIK